MKSAFWALLTIFIVNIFGLYYDWYFFSWFDTLLHFLGGLFMSLFMASYLKEYLNSSKIKNILIIIGATIFIGVIWEFCEYIASQTLTEYAKTVFGYNVYFMGNLDDTMTDLLMDILGSFTGSILFLLHFFRSRQTHKVQTVPQDYLSASTQD